MYLPLDVEILSPKLKEKVYIIKLMHNDNSTTTSMEGFTWPWSLTTFSQIKQLLFYWVGQELTEIYWNIPKAIYSVNVITIKIPI